jgi:epoxyqueuosine reductase
MKYLESDTRKRFDPSLHLADAKSVIVCALNYYSEPLNDPEKGYVSLYARGENYHDILKDMLNQLCGSLMMIVPEFKYKIMVDSSHVSEKTFALRAGLGFQGKNGLFIFTPSNMKNGNMAKGSFHYLGIIVTDLELELDYPAKGECGKCHRCMDACPTQAIVSDGIIDSSRCISYHTLENSNDIPVDISSKMGNIIYGCDICQLACPFNSGVSRSTNPRLAPRSDVLNLDTKTLLELTKCDVKRQFKGNSISEISNEMFRRNINLAYRNIAQV